MFKTELHCHSKGASPCARVNGEEIVEKFSKSGYSTLVLSNHFGQNVYEIYGFTDWQAFVDNFVGEYETVKRAAAEKLNVLLGIELRFVQNDNDYLVLGITEEFLRANPFFYTMTVAEFHEICKEQGFLLIQAHPFRNRMVIIPPSHLDGVEVFNGHFGHDSRNEIAELWAEKYSLLKTSGTDFHYADVPTNGGILTESKIQNMQELVEVFKSGNYQLIK